VTAGVDERRSRSAEKRAESANVEARLFDLRMGRLAETRVLMLAMTREAAGYRDSSIRLLYHRDHVQPELDRIAGPPTLREPEDGLGLRGGLYDGDASGCSHRGRCPSSASVDSGGLASTSMWRLAVAEIAT